MSALRHGEINARERRGRHLRRVDDEGAGDVLSARLAALLVASAAALRSALLRGGGS